MKKIISSFVITFLILSFSACTSGPLDMEEAETNVSTNVESGATNVDINSAFTMTFSSSVSSPSVTASTFFVVPTTVNPNLGAKASPSKSAIDAAICNPSNAIAGTITASTGGDCATIYTLTPTSALGAATEYALCATSGIGLCNPDLYGFFTGFMKTFTTTSASSSGTTYTVGGTISGLSGTIVLQNNSADDLSLTSNSAFTFATAIAGGAAYAVTVKTQPSGQTCTVSNGTGTISGANVTNVTITCADSPASTYTVGGTVAGLTGTVVLQNNSADDLSLTSNSAFTFATAIAGGAAYAVTVKTQPSGQTCTVSNGTGTISGANVTNVSVACVNNLIIFLTNTTTNGNIGSIAAADTLCTNDANKPATGTYKAILVDGTNRTTTTDWVLAANTPYLRVDGTTAIGTTNASATFDFPLDNSISGTSNQAWTGLNTDWSNNAFNCSSWTVGTSGGAGGYGYGHHTTSSSFSDGAVGCNASIRLYCAQQP